MFPDRDIQKLLDLVARTRVAGSTLLVAIDGLGGAGKSTLAAQLGDALGGVPVVAVDDFYRRLTEPDRGDLTPRDEYYRYFDWRRLGDEVLAPLSAGVSSRYRRHDWVTNTLAEWRGIEPGGVVIAEGVYSTRPELRPHFDVTVFVETPREQRLARMLDRMYDDVAWVERWMAAEDWYLENVRPGNHVDLVVDGSANPP